jgi:parafibromin
VGGVGGAMNPPGDAAGQLDAASQQAAAANAAAQQKTRTGYNRFDQERYAGKDETGGFSIDTKLTYQPLGGGMSLTPNPNAATPVHESSSSKSGYYQNGGSNGSLNGSANNQLVQQKTNVIANKVQPATGISANIANSGQQKRTHTKPIIIIPNTATSLITMYNVIDILQDLKYVL